MSADKKSCAAASCRLMSSPWLSGLLAIAELILGFVLLGFPFLLGASAVWVAGFVLGAAALVRLVQGVVQAPNRWWNLLTALVYGALGVLMVLQPVFSLELLTLTIGAVLLGEGALRLVLALALRSQAGMAWRVFNGLISAVLGGLVLWGWPGSSMWLLGTIIAIEMIFSGWTLLFLSVGSEERTLPEP
ncbi:MAG: HdeD family acid-resistance protein [Akkermansia sp.]